MLNISELTASIKDKTILDGVNLSIKAGEIHGVMGPNGAGKSTLAKALMGHHSLKCTGSIKLNGLEISSLPTHERARSGLFLAFQSPEEIEGVRVSNFIRKAISARDGIMDIEKMLNTQDMIEKESFELGVGQEFISREINVGFSGGERKRLEILQMVCLKPKLIILDEFDSGLDIDGIKIISKKIKDLNDGIRGFLIITHYPKIFDFIKPDKIHILSKGKIERSGSIELAKIIDNEGYSFTG